MKLVPTGFHVLVELRTVEQTVKDGVLKDFVLTSNTELQREQDGEPMGKVIGFGPLAFSGWEGCTADTPEKRAEQWGIKKGDMVIFSRYSGLLPTDFKKVEHLSRMRFIPDKEIIGKAEGVK